MFWRFAVLALVCGVALGGCRGPQGASDAMEGRAETPGSEQAATSSDAGAGAIQAGNITILDTRTDLTDRARAKQNVEDLMIRHPEVACLVGLWSYNGPAILSAVKAANRQGQTQIVCFDEEEDVLQGIAEGHIHATVVQQPYSFGYESVKTLAALRRGDKTVIPADGVIEIPVKVIRKENIEEFRTGLKQMLKGNAAPSPAGESSTEKVEIAFVTNNVSDFWQLAKAGVRKAETDFNAVCQFEMPPDGTAGDQQRIVEALMAKGISGMAISPCDAKNQVDLINKASQVMNVITQDSDAPGSNRLAYVGTNNYKAGREAGKLIREVLPEGGKIALFVGRMDAQNAIDRRQGIIDELSGLPLQQ